MGLGNSGDLQSPGICPALQGYYYVESLLAVVLDHNKMCRGVPLFSKACSLIRGAQWLSGRVLVLALCCVHEQDTLSSA